MHYRKVLLDKMIAGADPKDTPLKDALFETFCAKTKDVNRSIPKYIQNSLKLLRNEANKVR